MLGLMKYHMVLHIMNEIPDKGGIFKRKRSTFNSPWACTLEEDVTLK